ncbi:hypothetical protein HK104_003475 [Borealophlyctis nickersoniae]|nr:hypothetical protein HK104_003475 [Borealophlyctis nickersoniae]
MTSLWTSTTTTAAARISSTFTTRSVSLSRHTTTTTTRQFRSSTSAFMPRAATTIKPTPSSADNAPHSPPPAFDLPPEPIASDASTQRLASRKPSTRETDTVRQQKPFKYANPKHGVEDNDASPAHRRDKNKIYIKLSSVRKLAGWEKIQLLHDIVSNYQLDEAVAIYKMIDENGLLPRMKYADFHALYRILLMDPIKYRSQIIKVISDMKTVGFIPTKNCLETLISCCTKWRDMDFAFRIHDEMLSLRMTVGVDTYNDLLTICSQQRGLAGIQRGAKVWQDLLASEGEPTTTSFIRAMDIFGHLRKIDEAKKVYAAALAQLDKFRESVGLDDLAGLKMTKKRKADMKLIAQRQLVLGNAYMAALVTCGLFDEAEAVYRGYGQEGGPMAGEGLPSARAASDTLNVLLGMCAEHGDVEAAKRYFEELTRRNVPPTGVSYGRMIDVHGRVGDVEGAKRWFELSVERLGAQPATTKMLRLRNSLMIVYAKHGHLPEAMELLRTMIREWEERSRKEAEEAEAREEAEAEKRERARQKAIANRQTYLGPAEEDIPVLQQLTEKPKPTVRLLRSGLQAVIDAHIAAGDLKAALWVTDLLEMQGAPTSFKGGEEKQAGGVADGNLADEDMPATTSESPLLTRGDVLQKFRAMHPGKEGGVVGASA